jgi:TolB-like protein/Tfp pilus assembly protein PilF
MQTSSIPGRLKATPLASSAFFSSGQTGAGRSQFRPPRKNAVNPRNLFVELKRRNVYRAAAAYGVVSWLLVQIATQVFPFFDIPSWAIRMVVVILLLGFPVAVIMAWIYDVTPEGLQRTDEVAPGHALSQNAGRKIDFAIIGVLLTVIAFMAWQHWRPAKPDASNDQEYLSDGVTEQIIDSLAHLHDLFVVARTTAFSFKNKTGDIRDIGRQLHVTHVLEGSVRRGNGKVRVAAQLINVATGFHLWSETYDSTEQDLLFLQLDVAKKVASALQIELHLAETTQLAKPLTQDPAAYDLYLRGRYLLNKRTVDSIRKALTLFKEAVDKDGRFALGRVGVADSYILLAKIGALPGKEAAAVAWTEVTTALALDPQMAEGYVSRAILLTDFDWNWAEAEADFKKALALSPNNADAHHWYARHLEQLGREKEALAEIGAALQNDPLSPTIRVAKGKILFDAHRYREAVDSSKTALELEPSFASAYQVLAQAYAHLGEQTKAIEAATKYVELSQGSGWALLELAYVHAVAGHRAECDRIVSEVTARSGEFSPYDMATIRSAWHDPDGAMPWLEKAIAAHSVDVILIRVDPRLDNVRSDSRFKELLTRVAPRQ